MSAERPSDDDRPPSLTIRNGDVITPGGTGRATITVRGDRIGSVDDGAVLEPSPGGLGGPGAATIDATGLLVAPGLIDLQINGGFGHDLWSRPEAMWDLARLLPRSGVTAFLPTIVSSPPERVEAAMAALGRRPPGPVGAEPLGLHLEGPMLAPDRRGAHDEHHLRPPDPAIVSGWTRDRGVALVTLAPELPGAAAVIRLLCEAGVVVSAGHSGATGEEAAQAVADGVSLVTHLFNAMAPIHHRRPGLAGYTLATPALTAGLIADGIHVDPLMVAAAWRAIGPDRLVLVTDAVAAMGRPHGTHRFDHRTVVSDERGVRQADGTLAGSNLTLDAAVRNLVAFAGCDRERAIRTVTSTPARALGLSDRGRLEPGALADLVLLDPELRVVMTVRAGRPVHVDPTEAGRLSGVPVPQPAPA